jgi:outer membrane protein TolC
MVCLSSAALAQEQAAPLPNAPSHVLEQAAQKESALGKTAGSGAVYKVSATVPGPGHTTVEQASDGPLPLSLDDAISYGLSRNVRLKYDQANQRAVKGLSGTVIEALIPNLSFYGSTGAQEINLAAMGFKPQTLDEFASAIPGLDLSQFSTIVKVNTTQAQINVSQQLFNMPDIELYKGVKSEKALIDLNYLNSRGLVVNAVASAYLKLLADQANLTNAQAQEQAAKTVLYQATEKHNAGVGTNLDALRADVDYRQRQQATIAQQTAQAEDMMQLNRIMGLPADQQLELTDTAPFADLATMDLDQAKQTAYVRRKDFLALQAQIDVEQREYRAVKYQRLPTLAFNGNYGVLGETTGMYHGVFNAMGSLKFPIFREAAQRGEQDQISAQIEGLRQHEASLRVDIDAQIRSAILDVQASHDLVKVAQSNVDLAQQELSDEHDRFKAGVDDNLPVIDAEAAVTGAQAQLVQSLYQYNVAKLMLAQYTGVIESSYRTYLGSK